MAPYVAGSDIKLGARSPTCRPAVELDETCAGRRCSRAGRSTLLLRCRCSQPRARCRAISLVFARLALSSGYDDGREDAVRPEQMPGTSRRGAELDGWPLESQIVEGNSVIFPCDWSPASVIKLRYARCATVTCRFTAPLDERRKRKYRPADNGNSQQLDRSSSGAWAARYGPYPQRAWYGAYSARRAWIAPSTRCC